MLLTFVFLPYEAYISADAIVRTLVRIVWTQRRLLEWKTASDAERGADGSLGRHVPLDGVRADAWRRRVVAAELLPP